LDKWKRRVENAGTAWHESSENPLLGIVPLIGYEIEYEKTENIQQSALLLGSKLGFRKGYGNGGKVLETSPGPFADHKTAAMIFWSMVSSDVISLDRLYGQSVHLNLDLKHPLGTVSLMRWLQLTGLAYSPEYQKDNSPLSSYSQTDLNFHDLRIFEKHKDAIPYIECKEFTLMNPRDFVRFLRYSQVLATGLNMLHKATGVAMNRVAVDRDGSTKVSDFFWDMSTADVVKIIEMSSLNIFEKEIARIYIDGLGDLEESMSMCEVGDFLRTQVPTKTANLVVNEVAEVLPDLYSRTSNEPMLKQTEMQTTLNGKTFPNLVAMARGIATKTVYAIEQQLLEMEISMANELAESVMARDSSRVWRVCDNYKDLLRIEGMALVDKKKRIKRLIDRYKSIGWVKGL
jgi:hypothetical protein